jgi:hypothetical protein
LNQGDRVTRIAQASNPFPKRFQHTNNHIRPVSRVLAAVALSDNQRLSADTIVQRTWPDDTSALWFTRATSSPTKTSTASALTPTVTGDILLGLAPLSAATRHSPVPFNSTLLVYINSSSRILH